MRSIFGEMFSRRTLRRRVEDESKKANEVRRYGMNPFAMFLIKRMPLSELLKEHSELLDAGAMNSLFRQQAEEMLPKVDDHKIKDDLFEFMGMNPIGYIDRALRRAGIPDGDLDEAIQTITIKFLVNPGNLFRGWNTNQLFTPRFKVAVKNAVITLSQKRQKRSKRFQEMPQEPVARRTAAGEDDPITDFRNFVQLRYGDTALRVLDHRLAGGDTKELVGESGLESSYAVKKAVQQIKTAVVRWAGSHPDFLLRIHRLMDQEKATLAKRFAAKELVGMA